MSTEQNFSGIIQLIQQARVNAIRSVNTELVNLYWQIGEYISRQVASATWGDKTVEDLALFLQSNHPEIKGFNKRNLYRMKQFYETYASSTIVSSVGTQLLENRQDKTNVSAAGTQNTGEFEATTRAHLAVSDIKKTILAKLTWTHHRTIMARTDTNEEREFYIKMAIKENYTIRELDRQISSGLFERVMIGNQVTQARIHPSLPDITEKRSKTPTFLNF